MKRPTSVQQAIEHVAQQLVQAGVALGQGTLHHPDEAAWLVLWALHWPLDSDDQALAGPLSDEQWQAIEVVLKRRIERREPMAYLSGEAWLQGVPFVVDRRTIIPRSLIAEVLAQGLLDPYVPHANAHVLDLCTGNGSLAVLCAMAWPQAHVDAADLSPDALEVAQINITRHGLSEQITLYQGDGLGPVVGPYDLIVCNPPYVNATSMQALPPEFQLEPTMALAGGVDGMDFVRPLINQAANHLNPQGALVLEIGHEIEHFMRAFPRLGGLWLPTSAGDEQVVLLRHADLMGVKA